MEASAGAGIVSPRLSLRYTNTARGPSLPGATVQGLMLVYDWKVPQPSGVVAELETHIEATPWGSAPFMSSVTSRDGATLAPSLIFTDPTGTPGSVPLRMIYESFALSVAMAASTSIRGVEKPLNGSATTLLLETSASWTSAGAAAGTAVATATWGAACEVPAMLQVLALMAKP